MSKIFNSAKSLLLPTADKVPLIADIMLIGVGNETSAKSCSLPLLSITKLEDRGRFQVDCTLDGNLHVLAASGGVATCQLVFMERLELCDKNGKASAAESALSIYKSIKKNVGKAAVKVNVYGHNGEDVIASVTGIVAACDARSVDSQIGGTTLITSYTIVGVFNAD